MKTLYESIFNQGDVDEQLPIRIFRPRLEAANDWDYWRELDSSSNWDVGIHTEGHDMVVDFSSWCRIPRVDLNPTVLDNTEFPHLDTLRMINADMMISNTKNFNGCFKHLEARRVSIMSDNINCKSIKAATILIEHSKKMECEIDCELLVLYGSRTTTAKLQVESIADISKVRGNAPQLSIHCPSVSWDMFQKYTSWLSTKTIDGEWVDGMSGFDKFVGGISGPNRSISDIQKEEEPPYRVPPGFSITKLLNVHFKPEIINLDIEAWHFRFSRKFDKSLYGKAYNPKWKPQKTKDGYYVYICIES